MHRQGTYPWRARHRYRYGERPLIRVLQRLATRDNELHNTLNHIATEVTNSLNAQVHLLDTDIVAKAVIKRMAEMAARY